MNSDRMAYPAARASCNMIFSGNDREIRSVFLHISVRRIELENPDDQINAKPKLASIRYRTMNWSDYTASLTRSVSLSLWFDPKIPWRAKGSGKRGPSETFSDSTIQI